LVFKNNKKKIFFFKIKLKNKMKRKIEEGPVPINCTPHDINLLFEDKEGKCRKLVIKPREGYELRVNIVDSKKIS